MKKLTVMAACAALLLGGGCFLKANQMNEELLTENVNALTDFVEIVLRQGENGDGHSKEYLKKDSETIGTFKAGATWAGSGTVGNITFETKTKCVIKRWYCAGSSKDYDRCYPSQELDMLVCN